MPIGTVMWFNAEKGYGMIESPDSDKCVFLHRSAIPGIGLVNEGQKVSYDVIAGPQGARAYCADNIKVII